jgi:hypothetical protein
VASPSSSSAHPRRTLRSGAAVGLGRRGGGVVWVRGASVGSWRQCALWAACGGGGQPEETDHACRRRGGPWIMLLKDKESPQRTSRRLCLLPRVLSGLMRQQTMIYTSGVTAARHTPCTHKTPSRQNCFPPLAAPRHNVEGPCHHHSPSVHVDAPRHRGPATPRQPRRRRRWSRTSGTPARGWASSPCDADKANTAHNHQW